MNNFGRVWVMTGVVFLLVGMVFGLKMSMSMDFTLHGLHAHLNLLGFVVMTLFGLCYSQWPKMQEGVLCKVHYLIHTVSVAVAMSLLYVLLTRPELGPTIGPVMNYILMGTYAGVLLFAYLVFTRTKD